MFDGITSSDFWEPFLSASTQIEGNGPTDGKYSFYRIVFYVEAVLEKSNLGAIPKYPSNRDWKPER